MANFKGGVGKTSTAALLSWVLSAAGREGDVRERHAGLYAERLVARADALTSAASVETRLELQPDFLVVGPIIDPATLDHELDRLGWDPTMPPLHLMVLPPFSRRWAENAEGFGAVAATEALKERLDEADLGVTFEQDGLRAHGVLRRE